MEPINRVSNPIDEEWNERLKILEDARKLNQFAQFYLHPEKPVVADATACARCYFSRSSAPEQTSADDEEERTLALADAQQLKKSALDYLHPERPVEVASTAFGRSYFSRPSAGNQQDVEDAEERARILVEAEQLKKLAIDYLHPEKPVVESDPFAKGRNYFTRASAEEYQDEDDADDCDDIMEDMKQLKQLAVDYLHPEKPVITSDPFATGRNYFTRASAEEYEDEDDADDRDEIMEDMKQLEQLAKDYLQPERPVEVDPFVSSRNYFNRPSAISQEDLEEAKERATILAETQQLKKLAMDYLHPEKPVNTSDLCATGRNYFSRPSAQEYEDECDMEERAQILEDMKQLKKLAIDYLHPEKPVVESDPFAKGRNYFTRASAEEYQDEDDADDCDDIMEDMKQLKQLAVDYLHPEKPVITSDPFATGRNYFTRASAEEYEDEDDADDRDEIMEDMKQLEQLAKDYLQPERPVEVDPFVSSRNYFNRPSAISQEDLEEAKERATILAETQQLKKLAMDYLHPEKPVNTSDLCATGRNYFSRPSAQEYEDECDMEERAQILEDMKQLKKLAIDYLHPEKPVVANDPCAMGRNYFTRASAEEYEDDAEERSLVIAELKQLKKLATDYHHPEKSVETTDPYAVGRNYFMRASAPEQISLEAAAEEARLCGDSAQLKKLATDYYHPEKPVTSSPVAGRNYFDRASAPGHAEHIHSQGEVIEHGYDVADHGYYQYHYEQNDGDCHSHQSDHFEMDEDMFQDFRESLLATEPFKGEHPKEVAEGEGEEGKLSRSPSSVMLFEEAI